MKQITIHEARTQLSKLIQNAADGEDVIISRGPKPVARLIAIGEVKGKRQPGGLRGVLSVGPEFFEPLPAEELAGWE